MDHDSDPAMALEIALQNLESGGIGSDSEGEETGTTEPERSEGPPGKLLEEEGEGSSELTRERMSRLYSPSPAPSSAPSVVSDNSQLRQPITLDTVIQDSRLFTLFRRFLKDQCTTRNLNFWLACEHYRKLTQSDGQQFPLDVAKAIYFKFIKVSAPQRVTLLEQTKKQIKANLDLKQRATPDLFLTAQNEIWGVMNKNELRQFLVSGSIAADYPGLADKISVAPSVYTPSMANPAMGVCGGGSLQHSGSEDSASVSSFSTESDMGPRSCVMQLSRPFPTVRNAISDCEGHKPRSSHRRSDRHHQSTYVTKDKPVTEERFAALVQDRLSAVVKDREAMTKKVRERARQQKKAYEEIMALEWYDLPEAVKYLQYDETGTTGSQESSGQLQVPFVKPVASPLSTTNKDLNHISGLALREVQAALKDMEITNQVNEARRPFSRTSGCSSVLSTTSDSGVGDTLGNSGLVTPKQDRLAAYVYHQNTLSDRTSEREREARAAAMTLMHASPQPESLNPRVPSMRPHPSSDRHRGRPYSNYPEAYSSDDSSSCFTMTSHSSASDLFIPRRAPHRPAYSDNDESHHFGPRYHRRPLAQPRRSNRQQQTSHMTSHMTPSPIVEHQHLATPAASMNTSSTTPIKDKGHSGHTLVVYHLDQIPTPFAMRLPGTNITLRDFKDKVLKRPGSFRYFFKSYLEDVGEYLEECSDESMALPLFQGKIIGRVERID